MALNRVATVIEDITHWWEDMNFMFEWQERYLTSEHCEWVRILLLPLEQKIHIFELTCNVLFIIWTYWWWRFWWFSKDFRPLSKDFRRFSKTVEGQMSVPEHFPRISENFQRLPKTFEEDPKLFWWCTSLKNMNQFEKYKLVWKIWTSLKNMNQFEKYEPVW